MLTMNSHGVEISIVGCVEEMVRRPKSHVPGCPYIGVLASTLTMRHSYSRVTGLMTQGESSVKSIT